MRQREFAKMRMAPELKQAYIDFHGFPPDNFVESGQGAIANLPDLNTDPEAIRVLEALETDLNEITREPRNGDGNDGAGHEAAHDPD
jgi:hypothetical protein